jgi:PAS domain S-box-containing protein
MKRLFQSLSRTNDGAFIIDGRHRIVFWNQAAEEILGYTAEEVAGLQCYEILGGRDDQGRTLCQRFCRVALQAERGDVLPNQDVYTRTKIGEGRWLNVTTFAYRGGDKPLDQVIVHLFRDATEQKNYQRFVDRVLAASERLRQNDVYHEIPATPTDPRAARLTARERQVLALLVHGLGTAEIAGTLTISPSTVRNHVQNILDKLKVHSRLEAIAYTYQHGMIKNSEL